MTEDSARRDRVIAATMARIAAAPPPVVRPPAVIDIASWAKPALIAASLIILLSGALRLWRRTDPRGGDYVASALGVPVALMTYHATGSADSWSLLRPDGAGR